MARIVEDDANIISNRFVKSDIRKFYNGKTIFLTGSTGYLGKSLVEKILRGCPDVKRIYVLVREKKGISAEERIKNYFDDVLFGPLKAISNNFESKIHLVKGDLEHTDLDLSDEDRNAIINEVDIMIHNASTVRFNERISSALKINVMGTQAMLNLAKRCKRIEAFVYVSSAFCHHDQRIVMETVYPSPIDMKTVQDIINADLESPKGLSEEALKIIVGKFPNTYCFTKAIAEGLINEFGKQVSFSCIIYRPAVVISTWKEPFGGWCGNLNGPTMVSVSYALGFIHAVWIRDAIIDFIPADMTINSILVSLWDSVQNRKKKSVPHIYNYGSSVAKPVKMYRFRDMCMQPGHIITNPSIQAIWTNFCIYTWSRWYFWMCNILFHFLPALVIDAFALLVRKKPQALATLKKLTKVCSAIKFAVHNECLIDISEMNKAIDRMSAIDGELFFCDLRKLDWEDYCSTYWDGLRLYVLKDPVSTIPAARRKLRKIEAVHCIIKYGAILLIAYLGVRFLNLL